MKLIYTGENSLLVSNAKKNILENAVISAVLKNVFASEGLSNLTALDI